MSKRSRKASDAPREPVTVLLIDADATQPESIRRTLETAGGTPGAFRVESASSLAAGLARLAAGGIDVVLLELSLPDSRGMETLVRLRDSGPDVPILVLTAVDDEQLALQAVQAGAQDYLVRGQVTPRALKRVLRYTRERHRVHGALRDLALKDSLTELHNRRGFEALSEQLLKLAQRSGRGLVLLFVDLDGMKRLNDELGHAMGDEALRETADILRSTFRTSDVVARIGGDEFAVLAIDAPPGVVDLLTLRLIARIEARNAEPERLFPLSISLGAAALDPGRMSSVADLLQTADRAMYEHKRTKTTDSTSA